MGTGSRLWLRGLLAALISGLSNGLTSGSAAGMIAPDAFNLGDGLGRMVALVLVQAGTGAVLGLAAYLKQSPLPPEDSITVDIHTVTHTQALPPADPEAKS